MKGNLFERQPYAALYTRGLPGDVVRWSHFTVTNSKGWSGDFGPAQMQDLTEGFSYPWSMVAEDLKPDFIRGLPSMAMPQRNLVWDTHMFVHREVRPSDAERSISRSDVAEVDLAGAGIFRHKDLQLILTGNSKRNGQECAVIDYRAFFNTIEVKTPAFALVGLR